MVLGVGVGLKLGLGVGSKPPTLHQASSQGGEGDGLASGVRLVWGVGLGVRLGLGLAA